MSLPVISLRYLHANEVYYFDIGMKWQITTGFNLKRPEFFQYQVETFVTVERNDKEFAVNRALFFRLKLFFFLFYIQHYYNQKLIFFRSNALSDNNYIQDNTWIMTTELREMVLFFF